VNARRIYRTATLGTEYFWDVDIDDNSTTSLISNTADAALALVAVSSGDYVACPAGLDLVVGASWARVGSVEGEARHDVWLRARRRDELAHRDSDVSHWRRAVGDHRVCTTPRRPRDLQA
jgi:hypothetical protein